MTRQFRAWGDPHWMRWLFGAVLLLRLLFPFFNSPLSHLFSDPLRHWNNGLHFLHPDLMGGDDPFLYQAWLVALESLSQGSEAWINLGCALLPWVLREGGFRAREWLLPICGLGVCALLAVQSEGTMEGRFRKPLEPIFLAAAIVMAYRSRHREQALYYPL